MASIYVRMKDGTTRKFEHEGRSGGVIQRAFDMKGALQLLRMNGGTKQLSRQKIFQR